LNSHTSYGRDEGKIGRKRQERRKIPLYCVCYIAMIVLKRIMFYPCMKILLLCKCQFTRAVATPTKLISTAVLKQQAKEL
jgi:hypothetical protein